MYCVMLFLCSQNFHTRYRSCIVLAMSLINENLYFSLVIFKANSLLTILSATFTLHLVKSWQMWQSLYGTSAIPKITDAIMNNLPGINWKPSKHWVPYPEHTSPRPRRLTVAKREMGTRMQNFGGWKAFSG